MPSHRALYHRRPSNAFIAAAMIIGFCSPTAAFDLQTGWPVIIPDDIVLGPPLIADLDGDGTREVVATSAGSFVDDSGFMYVFQWDGSDFGPFPLNIARKVGLAAAADLDGDGRLEIVAPVDAGTPSPKLVVIRTTDGGSYPGWPVPTEAGRPTVADVDGDGTPEVLASGIEGVKIFSAAGMLRANLYTGLECPGMQAVTDIDGDGAMEIAVGTTRGVFLFDPLGNVLPGWPRGTDLYPGPITMADVDRDGTADLAAPDQSYRLNLWHADGALFFTIDAHASIFAEVVPHDLDGDGELELLFIRDFGDHAGVDARHHDGSAVAGWPQEMIGGTGGNGNAYGEPGPTIADLNGDGSAEVLAATNRLDTFYIYGWERDGTAVSGFPISIGPDHGVAPDGSGQIAVSDLDGDGDVELVWFGFEQRLSQGIHRTIIYVWDLPGSWGADASPWPQFHQGPEHRGSVDGLQPGGVEEPFASSRLRVEVAPNPFRPGRSRTARLSFLGVSGSPGTACRGFRIIDLAGRSIRSLACEAGGAMGSANASWDGRDESGRPAASGIFLIRPVGPNEGTGSSRAANPARTTGRITLIQ